MSPVLLSHRAPLHTATVRERHLHGGRSDALGAPPVPAAPAAPLVPALAQEEAVLDLSSPARPGENPGRAVPLSHIPLSSGDFPGLGSEVQLRRVPPPPSLEATFTTTRTAASEVSPQAASTSRASWTAVRNPHISSRYS